MTAKIPARVTDAETVKYMLWHLLEAERRCITGYDKNRYLAFVYRRISAGLKRDLIDRFGFTHRELNHFLNTDDATREKLYPTLESVSTDWRR